MYHSTARRAIKLRPSAILQKYNGVSGGDYGRRLILISVMRQDLAPFTDAEAEKVNRGFGESGPLC